MVVKYFSAASNPAPAPKHLTPEDAIEELKKRQLKDPVELLRLLQKMLMTGRDLDVNPDPFAMDEDDDDENDEVNDIEVSRCRPLDSLEEIKDIENVFLPLRVQFVGEVSMHK